MPIRVLDQHRWRVAERAHRDDVDERLKDHLARRRAGGRHPVHDFLFTYYRLRPAGLRRWHPGLGVGLAGPAPHADWRWYRAGEVVSLDVAAFLADRAGPLARTSAVLDGTASRPPAFTCFGLHEWAMVYRVPEGGQRHEAWPLRLGAAGSDAVVEAAQVRCTHFDAYRFFTPDAVPRNSLAPTRASQPELEQPGCVHATMDLYKHAYTLGPAVPGELLLACFDLARRAREVDMRASPYDLADLGYQPIRIEEPAGRAEYVRAQAELTAQAAPLRERLRTICRGLGL